MHQEHPPIDRFKQQLRASLQRDPQTSRTTTIAKQAHVYTCGDPGNTLYYIESGQVKLLMLSPEGRECLLAIYTAGDLFGESCLSGSGVRLETAIAREETVLRPLTIPRFFAQLGRDGLGEGFMKYLTVRIADQQEVIANLVTADSEQRLGKTLLQLARKLGKQDPRSIRMGKDIRIEHEISQEDLSEMVGTTRPRITTFMQRFRNLGLVETSAEHFLIIKENKLTDYLALIA